MTRAVRLPVLLLIACICHSACASEPVVSAFDKTARGIQRHYGPPDYAYSEIRRISPDRKYVARILTGDAEIGLLTVYRIRPGLRHFTRRDAVSVEFDDVNGCIWVPHRPHTLLVSTGGSDYGVGLLAMWTGRRHPRILLHAKSRYGEGYNIRGISSDGKTLIYEHFGVNSPDPNDLRNTHLKRAIPVR